MNIVIGTIQRLRLNQAEPVITIILMKQVDGIFLPM